jgi:NTP pyrophosphatase (non-canonical NTP hydrolase)
MNMMSPSPEERAVCEIRDHLQRAGMSHPIYAEVEAELARARHKFPKSDHLVLALAEEAGEVTKAALDLHYGKGTPEELRKEIVQAIAMCVRLAEEGDPTLAIGGHL